MTVATELALGRMSHLVLSVNQEAIVQPRTKTKMRRKMKSQQMTEKKMRKAKVQQKTGTRKPKQKENHKVHEEKQIIVRGNHRPTRHESSQDDGGG